MKICVISDTHGQKIEIPECDLLLHCGDISPMEDHSIEYQKEWFFTKFLPELVALPAKHIVFIGGDHDFWLEHLALMGREWKLREALPLHIHYLRDTAVSILGWNIYGTPWVPVLQQWAFYAPEKSQLKPFPSGTDILLTHSPPHGCCDRIEQWDSREHLGSKDVRDSALASNPPPKYIFCGHIHSGAHEFEALGFQIPTAVRNCSLLDEDYKKAYDPLILEV